MVDMRKAAAAEERNPLVKGGGSGTVSKKTDDSLSSKKRKKSSVWNQLSRSRKIVAGLILWGLVMGLVFFGGNSTLQMQQESSTPSPSISPTMMGPTTTPSSSPSTSVPTTAPTSREAYVKTTLRKFFAHKADFRHTKAFHWMIEADTFLPDDEYMVLERYVLAHVYFELNGQDWTFNPSWLTPQSACDWHRKEAYDGEFLGARCDVINNTPPAISNIDFAENNLKGSLPTEVALLTGLTYMNLYRNEVNSTIPTEIGSLIGLREIEFGHNEFTGHIPSEVGNLVVMTTLNMPFNQLNSTIPSEIGQLTELTRLSFAWNQLSGEVPHLPPSLLDCWLYKNRFADTTNGVLSGCHL